MTSQPVTIETLNKGAAMDLFNESLKKILKNIADPNTKAKAKRELVLKCTFTPTGENRNTVNTTMEAAVKLAQIQPTDEDLMFISFDGSEYTAITSSYDQPELDLVEDRTQDEDDDDIIINFDAQEA